MGNLLEPTCEGKTPNFDEKIVKNYHENSDKAYIFEIDVEYSKKLND